MTLHSLLNTHPDAGVIRSGDRNSIDIPTLLSIVPSLHQTVKLPTRVLKTLDVTVTNLARFFNEPIIIPPVMPDVSGLGVPINHSWVFAIPNTRSTQVTQRTKVTKKVRPLPDSLFQTFKEKMENEDFQFIREMTSSQMVQNF